MSLAFEISAAAEIDSVQLLDFALAPSVLVGYPLFLVSQGGLGS